MNHRYRLVRKLGEGGMGEVWLAADEVEGGREVALKLLHQDKIRNDAAVAYFKQEFAALARLRHPNLARVHDFGLVEGQSPRRCFFTAEYVPGADLYRLCAPDPPYERLYGWTVQALRALAYIHARGLIHHDVKPSNLVVAGDTVKLLDFGLAGARTSKLDGIRGTVRYLAPEIAKGGPIDERADLYSLGVTLYQVTTRRLPFEGETTLSVLRKHLDQVPEPPSGIRADLPPALERFILRLVAKEPADRYPSADEAIRDLARLTGRPFPVETGETRASAVLSGRFVGRDETVARLRVSGAGAFLVTGESGLGKSRLLRELKYVFQLDGATVLVGRAGGGPWAPWPEVVEQAARLVESLEGGARLVERHRAAIGPLLSGSAGTPSSPSPSPSASPSPNAAAGGTAGEEGRARLIDGAAAFLAALAARRPVVILVDDLDAADRGGLDLFARIARDLKEREPGVRSALVVGAARAEDPGPPAPLADLVAEGAAEEVRLRPLDAGAVAALVASMTGAPPPPIAFAERLAAETGGNPLFIEEVMKSRADEGLALAALAARPLPASVGEALARRLERLGDDERRALEALAVFGRPASAVDLAHLLDAPLDAVYPALRALERRQLATPERAASEGFAPRLQVSSARARDLVLGRVDPDRRREMHARAVLLLEAAPPAERDAEAVAEHARGAGDGPRAVRYALEAAARAAAVFANDEAIAAYGLAIEVLDASARGAEPGAAPGALLPPAVPAAADGSRTDLRRALAGRGEVALLAGESDLARRDFERLVALVRAATADPSGKTPGGGAGGGEPEPAGALVRALLGLGRARAALGDADSARGAFAEALETARAAADPAAPAEALRELGNVEFSQGRYDAALVRLDEALQAVRGHGDRGALARVLRDLATCLREKGAYERALECAREALAIATALGDRPGVARALRDVAQVLYYRGAYGEAADAAREAADRSREIGHPGGVAAALNLTGHILLARGRVDEARARYEEALGTWRRIGDRPGIAAILNNLGCIDDTLGEPARAVERFEEAARHFEALGYRGAVALARANLAGSHLLLGRLDEAERLAALSTSLAGAVGNVRFEIEGRRARGEARYRRGDLAGAREALLEAAAAGRSIGNKSALAACRLALAPAARALGRLREAREAVDEGLGLAASIGDRSLLARARLETARLAHDEGRPGPALAALDEAAAAAREAQDRPAEIETLLFRARLLRSLGDADGARHAAEEASDRARSLGLLLHSPWAELEAGALEAARAGAEAQGQTLLAARTELAEARRLLSAPEPSGTDLERADDLLDRAARAAEAAGAVLLGAEAAIARGEAAIARGDGEAAATHAARARAAALESGALGLGLEAEALAGRAALLAGRRDEAARRLKSALERAREVWRELPDAFRDRFLATPELRAARAAALELVGAAPAPRAALAAEGDEASAAPAISDALTPLFTHAYFLQRLDEELARAQRHARELSLLKLSAEGYPLLEEVRGAAAGRDAVRALSDILARSLREGDVCARFFGAEFEVLLPDTDIEGARQLAERLKQAVAATPVLAGGERWELALSVGAVAFPRDGSERDPLLGRLDDALKRARSGGGGATFAFPEGGAAALPPDGSRNGADVRGLLLTREGRAILGIVHRVVAAELDLDRLLELVAGMVCEATRAERGFVLLREPDGRLVVRARRAPPPAAAPAPAAAATPAQGPTPTPPPSRPASAETSPADLAPPDPAAAEVELSRGIAERVARTGEAVLVAEAGEDPQFRDLASVADLKLRSVLAAPLVVDGAVIGVISVDSSAVARKFARADLNFLVAIAAEIAVPIAGSLRLREREEELRAAREKLSDARLERLETKYSYDRIVGRSAAMQKVFQLLDRVVDTTHPVVIFGESGTGKELVARAIHYNGPRKMKPFVAENCAALTDTLLEAELFGYMKGAFTGADRDSKGLFELANGGTLFLDEIGDMSERMQKKLLRVLQEGEVRPVGGKRVVKVDVRIISASNKDLRKLVQEGQFREDLFYRLNVMSVALPPLRDRKEDIPLLIEHFLRKAARPGEESKTLDREVLRLLVEHDWAGNVRELENEILRLVAMSDDVIGLQALSPRIREKRPPRGGPGSLLERFKGKKLREVEEEVLRELILEALEHTNWHKTQTAELLGVPTSTLFNKMRKLGIA